MLLQDGGWRLEYAPQAAECALKPDRREGIVLPTLGLALRIAVSLELVRGVSGGVLAAISRMLPMSGRYWLVSGWLAGRVGRCGCLSEWIVGCPDSWLGREKGFREGV